MKTFKSLGALEGAIQAAAANAIMSNGVVNVIKDEIRKQEQDLVYGSYSPVSYGRRGSLGYNFEVQRTGKYSIRVWDTAPPNASVFGTPYGGPPGMFAQWINDGCVPNVFNTLTYPWMGARPFYRAAEAALQGSAALRRALISGIKNFL